MPSNRQAAAPRLRDGNSGIDRWVPRGAVRPIPHLLLLLAAFIPILLSSCYGSTRPVVKIGLIGPFEELYRAEGYAALHAVRLAIAQRNAEGGVAGHDVLLVALNDNADPQESRLQAVKLALDPAVLGAVGPLDTRTAQLAGEELAAHGLAWIAPVPLLPSGLSGGYALSAGPDVIAQEALSLFEAEHAVDSVTVYSDQLAALAGSAPPVMSPGLAVDTLPLSAAGEAMPASSAIVWLGDAAGGARLASRAAAGSGRPLIGGPEVGRAVFAGRAGTDAGGVRWLSSGPAVEDLPADFVTAYRDLAGADPGPQAVLAFDAANLLMDAMALAGSEAKRLDRSAVRSALQALGAAGWSGLSGLVQWDEVGRWQQAPLHLYEWPVIDGGG